MTEKPLGPPTTNTSEPQTGRSCHMDDLPRLKAAGQACRECPFRESNRDRKHFADDYSDGEFTRIWNSVAVEGRFFGCHLTDSDYQPFPQESRAMGYKQPADIGARRECAGSVAMIQRELRLAADHGNHAQYIEARPVGFSRRAFQIVNERLKGNLVPELRFAPDPDESDLTDPVERVETDSWAWAVGREGIADLSIVVQTLAGATCDCQLCTNHTDAHTALTLTTADGECVEVDAQLHGLLSSLAAAGIRTTDSCINIADALDQLWPERKATLLRAPAGGMNYSDMIRGQAAHVRLRNDRPAEIAFITAASQLPGVEAAATGPLTQIVFQEDDIPPLTAMALAAGRVLTVKAPANRKSPSDHTPPNGKRTAARKRKTRR